MVDRVGYPGPEDDAALGPVALPNAVYGGQGDLGSRAGLQPDPQSQRASRAVGGTASARREFQSDAASGAWRLAAAVDDDGRRVPASGPSVVAELAKATGRATA